MKLTLELEPDTEDEETQMMKDLFDELKLDSSLMLDGDSVEFSFTQAQTLQHSIVNVYSNNENREMPEKVKKYFDTYEDMQHSVYIIYTKPT